ncbi:serine/threonine-protein kinase, partial [Halorubrum ezzemoulense]
LKQPSFSTTVSTDTYDHILKEAHNWSQWDDHPHIVQVLDWGTQPGPWIALEYMDGGTLDEYIGSMSVEQRLWTAYMIGSAVAYANIKGLAHHDIKPNNILFRKTPEGKWNLPKVADWGLSREIIQATGSISQATPDYAAPEHFNAIMPEEPVDERTDIYQLGVICYEVLTGTHPNHLRGNVPLPSTIDESLPSGIDDVISKAIIQDRDERYEHALVFRQEIETVLSSEFPSLLDD